MKNLIEVTERKDPAENQSMATLRNITEKVASYPADKQAMIACALQAFVIGHELGEESRKGA